MRLLTSNLLTCLTVALPTLVTPVLAAEAILTPAQPPAADSLTLAQNRQERLRVAVLDFDFASTGATTTLTNLVGANGPERGISELLVNRLAQSSDFILIERNRIEAILQEQNLGASGRIDPSTAAEIGRILGADAVIVGSITRFNLDQQSSGVRVLGVGVGNRRVNAEVSLTARLVNTTTAEIVAVAEGNGTSNQRDNTVNVGAIFGSGEASNNENELLSNAAYNAVAQLAEQLVAATPASMSRALPTVAAIIADVTGNTVIINRGSQDGFRTGMILSVERVSREVIDPATGEVLRLVTVPVGRIELTDVDVRSGVGTLIQGSGLQVGDRAVAVE